MDLLYIILLWLKSFMERMKVITSFIAGDFLPDTDQDEVDDDFFFPSHGNGHKKH